MSPPITYTPEAYIVVIIGDEDGGQSFLYNLDTHQSERIEDGADLGRED